MIILVIIAVFIVPIAGCTSRLNSPADAKMAGIDAGLRTGPVFVEFGAPWCTWCEKEKLVVRDLSANYSSVTFVDVDTDVNRTLAGDFYVEGIPQMNVIVKKNPDGSYLYIDQYGNTTTDRFKSKIAGFREHDELKPLLDAAVAAR